MVEVEDIEGLKRLDISEPSQILYDRLDELLERYLGLLDDYQKCRQALNESMSSVSVQEAKMIDHYKLSLR